MRSVVKLMVGVLILLLGIGAGIYVEHVFLAQEPSSLIQSSQAQNGHQANLAGLETDEAKLGDQHGLMAQSLVEHGLAEHGLAEHGLAEHGLAEHSVAKSSLVKETEQVPVQSLWDRIKARLGQWFDRWLEPGVTIEELNRVQLANESQMEALQLLHVQLRQQTELAETSGRESKQALRYQLNLVERTIFQSPRFLLLESKEAEVLSLIKNGNLEHAYQILQNKRHYLSEAHLRFAAAGQVYSLYQTLASERQALEEKLGRLDLESTYLRLSMNRYQRDLAQLEASGQLSRFVAQAQRFILDMQESNTDLTRLASALERARLNQAKWKRLRHSYGLSENEDVLAAQRTFDAGLRHFSEGKVAKAERAFADAAQAWLQLHDARQDETIARDVSREVAVIEHLQGVQQARREADRRRVQILIDRATPQVVTISGGDFLMGDLRLEPDPNESPAVIRKVKAFQLSKTEVTFDQYDAYCELSGEAKPDDQGWGRGQRPVINVSWSQAEAYARWLSAKTGDQYRLPSESEWEFALKAGRQTPYFWGQYPNAGYANGDSDFGWPDDGFEYTAPVASFKANANGLYDMSGNVQEWVADCWRFTHYDQGDADREPRAGNAQKEQKMTQEQLIARYRSLKHEDDCSKRVVKGGSWYYKADELRSAYRGSLPLNGRYSSVGFRLLKVLP
jgi:formylglycine-generating enzyme required for sulfatase activity